MTDFLNGSIESSAVVQKLRIYKLEMQLKQAENDIRMLGRMGTNICPVCAHYNHGEGDKQKCVTCIINRETDNFAWRGMKEG